MDVLLFGPPGAGKGTQADAVRAALGIIHVSTGDIFRKHLREGTELGLMARSYMDKGALVPDAVVVNIVASRLTEPDAAGGALFDGFPRTVRQAELLSDWLNRNNRRIDIALNLTILDEVVVNRLSGRRTCTQCGATYHVENNPPAADNSCLRCGSAVVQRKDDSEQIVSDRLTTYHRDTAPVLIWLREHTHVVDVDADRPIEMVQADLLRALQQPA
jgi:adenylate kinase